MREFQEHVICPTCLEPIIEEELTRAAQFHVKYPDRPLLLVSVDDTVYHAECVYTPQRTAYAPQPRIRDATGHLIVPAVMTDQRRLPTLGESRP